MEKKIKAQENVTKKKAYQSPKFSLFGSFTQLTRNNAGNAYPDTGQSWHRAS